MMNDLAQLAQAEIGKASQPRETETIRKLFIFLHGNYGNLFINKFATGEKDQSGKDKGIRAAMLVWTSELFKYPPNVIEAACERMKQVHAEYPPSLPQFRTLCEAAMPRKTYSEEMGLPALPAPRQRIGEVSYVPKNDGRDWARKILARKEAGEKISPTIMQMARDGLAFKG